MPEPRLIRPSCTIRLSIVARGMSVPIYSCPWVSIGAPKCGIAEGKGRLGPDEEDDEDDG